MEPLRVRLYRREDAGACCAVIKACIPLMAGLNDAARQFLHAKNQPATLDAELSRFFTLVLVDGERVMGLGALHGNEVKRVYVDPALHGSGGGRALLQELEAEAQRRGIRELVVESSLNAEQFYARSGYRARGKDHFSIDQARFEFVRMSKVCVTAPRQRRA